MKASNINEEEYIYIYICSMTIGLNNSYSWNCCRKQIVVGGSDCCFAHGIIYRLIFSVCVRERNERKAKNEIVKTNGH